MKKKSVAKFLILSLFLMIIILPGNVRAAALDEGIGELLTNLSDMYEACETHLEKNPEDMCDLIYKIKTYETYINESIFVSGNMKVGSGEIKVTFSPEMLDRIPGATADTTFSITYDHKIYMAIVGEDKEEMAIEDQRFYFESFVDGDGTTNIKNAFAACQTYLANNPHSVCDSLELLEENGLELSPYIKSMVTDMDISSGSIAIYHRFNLYPYVADHRGELHRERIYKVQVEKDIKDAYTACMVYLLDNPGSRCNSLKELEEHGYTKGDLVEFVRADMDADSGIIVLKSKDTGMVAEITHNDGVGTIVYLK